MKHFKHQHFFSKLPFLWNCASNKERYVDQIVSKSFTSQYSLYENLGAPKFCAGKVAQNLHKVSTVLVGGEISSPLLGTEGLS